MQSIAASVVVAVTRLAEQHQLEGEADCVQSELPPLVRHLIFCLPKRIGCSAVEENNSLGCIFTLVRTIEQLHSAFITCAILWLISAILGSSTRCRILIVMYRSKPSSWKTSNQHHRPYHMTIFIQASLLWHQVPLKAPLHHSCPRKLSRTLSRAILSLTLIFRCVAPLHASTAPKWQRAELKRQRQQIAPMHRSVVLLCPISLQIAAQRRQQQSGMLHHASSPRRAASLPN
jgi:hypothetical protein